MGQAFGTEYATFDPRQIKSATANIGTYSRDNLSFTDREKGIMQTQESADNLFKPDPTADRQYRAKLAALFESRISKSQTIDMGRLPLMYSFLGIADKQLKTNGKTILKALGFEGRNRHHVPLETIENLLSLACDPKAVFKSPSKSNNPNAYIAVLDAKAANKEQIIAILSPSNDGRGFMFIPSVYEKHNFDKYFARICEEQKTLYIKNKGSELWGQLQSLPRHNSEPYGKNIPTKDDIVKRFLESMQAKAKSPSLEGRNNNSKEKPMSDLSEETAEEKSLSPRELAFQNTVYQRNMVGAALKNGTLCCLPDKDGYADTAPAMNLANHHVYHGDTLLYLKDHQKKNGFPTGEYLTQAQIEKAREDVPGLSILKGQKGVSIHVSEKNDETGKWDEKHIRLFNVAQLNSPKNFKNWVEDKRLEYFQSQHGTKIQPEPGRKAEGPEIACPAADPVVYLGRYFAAVSKGVPFKADRETAKEFAKNLGDSLYEQGISPKTGEPMVSPKTGEPVTDPFKLSRICMEASKYCVEFMKELSRQQSQEQKQEQQQSKKGHHF